MIDALRFALISLYTVVIGTAICGVSLFDRSGELALRLARIWIGWILTTYRVHVEAVGLENLSPHRPYVFMANHESAFDIAAIVDTLPGSFRFVAKKELTRIPFFGWALVMAGHLIVDRSNRERAIASLARGADRIREGTNVIMFPEGTRSESGQLAEFKSGGFHLALQAGVPIVPVSVCGGRSVAPKGSLRSRGGLIRVRYGKPIPTAALSLDDRNTLKADVRQAILEGLAAGHSDRIEAMPRCPGAIPDHEI